MYITRYLIQSLLTGYAPCSISFKATDSNPCLRKTNKLQNIKNHGTSTAKVRQLRYSVCLCTEGSRYDGKASTEQKPTSRAGYNTESLVGLRKWPAYVSDARNKTVRRLCAIFMSIDRVRVYTHEKTGGDSTNKLYHPPHHVSLPYQTFVWMQAAVAARLWNMRRIAQHPSVARLIHPTGGAPRVTAVMAICKGQRKP